MKNRLFTLIISFVLLSIPVMAQNKTIIIMQDNTGLINQSWFYSGSGNSLQSEEIKKFWNENKYITAAAYTSNGWFVSMAKGTKWTNQSYKNTSQWPDAWIHEKMDAGYMITSLASSDNNWLIVMSEGTDYTKQEICGAPWSSLKEFIKNWWDEDYYITGIACQNGMWTVVMSQTSLYSGQSYFGASDTSTLKTKIKEKWDAGYIITALEYGGGEFLCIMSKRKDGKATKEYWQVNPSDVSKHIKEYWDQYYNISYIGG